MLAVFVNCFTVIVGGLIGVLFSSKIKESLSVTVQNAAGVITLVLGFEMAFQYESIICLTLSLILGGVIGTALDIDGAIYKLGKFFEKLVERKNQKSQDDEENLTEVVEVKNQLAAKKDFGLQGLMETHHYGWYPSFISDLAQWMYWSNGPTLDEALHALAARDFSHETADTVVNV